MFRVTCFCEDNKLGVVKRALAQVGVQNVVDQPVVNAEPDGKGKVKAQTDGSGVERLWHCIRKGTGHTVNTNWLKKQVQGLGMAPDYTYALATQLVSLRRLKKTGKGQYKILGERNGKKKV